MPFGLWDLAGLAIGAFSAKESSDAAKEAGRIQSEAIDRASDIIEDQFNRTETRLEPYMDAGLPALDRQSAILGLEGPEAQTEAYDAAFAGPGFKYVRDRVIDDVNRNASATGMLRSGNRLAALTDRLAGLYATYEGDYFNRLGAITGVGLGATSSMAGVGGNAAAGQANLDVAGGDALANARLNRSSALQSGVADLYGTARSAFERP